jgi:hypothetical protein
VQQPPRRWPDGSRHYRFTIGAESAGDCASVLGELRRQTRRDAIEIVIVTPTRDGLPPDALDGFAAHQWIIVPDVRACGPAMAAAVRAARAAFPSSSRATLSAAT